MCVRARLTVCVLASTSKKSKKDWWKQDWRLARELYSNFNKVLHAFKKQLKKMNGRQMMRLLYIIYVIYIF